MFENKLYIKSPNCIQELMICFRSYFRNSLRQTFSFKHALSEIKKTEWLDKTELLELELNRLRTMLEHAENNVPYYQRLFRHIGISPHKIQDPQDLKYIPLLKKADLIEHSTLFLSKELKPWHSKGTTSGTTGSPVTIFQDINCITRENAFIWRQLNWAGFRKGEKRAWLRGDLIVPYQQKHPPFWRINRADNMLMLSSYHLSEKFASNYIESLYNFDPVLIQAYPSSIGFLARYLDERNKDYPGRSLRGIVTSSESLALDVREIIEKRFGCRVFDWYGLYERVAAIGTCEEGKYHIISDYGFFETIPKENGLFEIVGTGFNNFLMPLIRYATGDQIEMDLPESTCKCGRAMPLVKRIEGRSNDSIKTEDGRHISRLGYIFKGLKNIAESQLIQESLNKITILIVPFEGFNRETEEALLFNARARLGNEFEIKIETVTKIPRSTNGKLRFIVSKV